MTLPDLTALQWRRVEPQQRWQDGTQILAAIELVSGVTYSVLTIRCDEDRFDVEFDGELWGYDISDVSAFVVLSGSVT